MARQWLAVVLVVTVLGAVVWASDKISFEGERTIYTVQCPDGVWQGWRCTGKLVAGERYRFRASKSRQEVLFSVVGSAAPSGKYTDCTVEDRGNWICKVSVGHPATITHEMVHGRPKSTDAGLTLPFHAVRKWEWWILRAGVHIYTNADY